MTRETDPNNTYIGDFQNTGGIVDLPETDGTILVSEVDDQIRDAKQMIYNTFKSCDGEVTADHTELSYTDGAEQNLALWTKGQTATGLAIATGNGSTPNTYTLTTGLSHTLADGDAFTFQCDEASIGASLLKVDSNTARNLVDKNGTNIDSGDISINSIVEVRYDASAQKFYLLGGITAGGGTPVPTSVFYTSGDNLFTASVTGNHVFELIGGGASGASGGGAPGSCGGGGGGGYLKVTLSLTIGDEIVCSVGSGGRSVFATNAGNDGTRSEIRLLPSNDIYFANEGMGGQTTDAGAGGGSGGAGGGTSGTGPFQPTTTFNGGNGGNGNLGVGAQIGGGGGSAAGTLTNGNNGTAGGVGAGSDGNGASGSNGASGGTSPEDEGDDAGNPTLNATHSGGGGSGGTGVTDYGGGYGGDYGSGGGGSGDSSATGPSGSGAPGVILIDWS